MSKIKCIVKVITRKARELKRNIISSDEYSREERMERSW